MTEKTPYISVVFGGEGGIRTHETVARLHAFQACAFDHSATSPKQSYVPSFRVDRR